MTAGVVTAIERREVVLGACCSPREHTVISDEIVRELSATTKAVEDAILAWHHFNVATVGESNQAFLWNGAEYAEKMKTDVLHVLSAEKTSEKYLVANRDSKSRISIVPPSGPAQPDPEENKGTANEFGLTAGDVLREVSQHVGVVGSFSYEDTVVAKKTFDAANLQYGTHLQAVRVEAMFRAMDREVSDNGIRTVTDLLNTVRQIHIRDFVLFIAEVVKQDPPRLVAQKEAGDADREKNEQRRQRIGDVLTIGDVWGIILRCLPVGDILRMGATCRTLWAFATRDDLWRCVLLRDNPLEPKTAPMAARYHGAALYRRHISLRRIF